MKRNLNTTSGETSVNHIFGGIPTNLIDPNGMPEENLSSISEHLERLGIHIHPSCKIANSTLLRLVNYVNGALSPSPKIDDETMLLIGGNCLVKSTPATEAMSDAIETRNFDINLEEGVVIGGRVVIGPSVHVGKNTTVGDRVELFTTARIGRSCEIGKCSLINAGCKIDDCSIVQDRTVFPPGTEVPKHSSVEHESEESAMATIRTRLRLV